MTITYFAVYSDDRIESVENWETHRYNTDVVIFIFSIYEDGDVWYKRRYEFRDKDGNPICFEYECFTVLKIGKSSSQYLYVGTGRINPITNTPWNNVDIPLTIQCNNSSTIFDTSLPQHPNFGVKDFYAGLKDFLNELYRYQHYNRYDNFGGLWARSYRYMYENRILTEKVKVYKDCIDNKEQEHKELKKHHEALQSGHKQLIKYIDGISRKFDKMKKMISKIKVD